MKISYKLLSGTCVFILVMLACTVGQSSGSGNGDSNATLAALAIQATIDTASRLTLEANSGGNNGGNNGNAQPPPANNPPGQQGAPSDTPQPAAPPTQTLTATPDKVTVSVSVDTNCRFGPGNLYDYVGALLVGETAEVLGWDGRGDFYYIVNPDRPGGCWLWGQYATINGNTSNLPVFTPPPTPTPTFTPTPEFRFQGNWNMIIEGSTYSINVTQGVNSVSGSFVTVGGDTVNFSGSVSADGTTVNGNYTVSNGTTGTFIWQLKKNVNQFIGSGTSNSNVTGEWCGYRTGASPPSPCKFP